jgi:hypothetical protein
VAHDLGGGVPGEPGEGRVDPDQRSSARRGSVIVKDISVATTARSRSTSSCRRSPFSVPVSCRNTTNARSSRPSVVPSDSPKPVTQRSLPSLASRWSGVADEPRRAASCTATGSPAHRHSRRDQRRAASSVSLIRRPPRSVRPAASLQASMSTGSRTRSPVSSIAAGLA